MSSDNIVQFNGNRQQRRLQGQRAKIAAPPMQISLYDYSKQLVANEVPMERDVLVQKVHELAAAGLKRHYSMLLCNDRRDFTIFRTIEGSSTEEQYFNDLLETLLNRGIILLIDEQADGAYEIWIRDEITGDNFAYYFFDYSSAVITVGE